MKTLKKLIIKPEKVIKNDELVNLRGGDYGPTACCICTGETGEPLGYVVGILPIDCEGSCEDLFGGCADGDWIC